MEIEERRRIKKQREREAEERRRTCLRGGCGEMERGRGKKNESCWEIEVRVGEDLEKRRKKN